MMVGVLVQVKGKIHFDFWHKIVELLALAATELHCLIYALKVDMKIDGSPVSNSSACDYIVFVGADCLTAEQCNVLDDNFLVVCSVGLLCLNHMASVLSIC